MIYLTVAPSFVNRTEVTCLFWLYSKDGSQLAHLTSTFNGPYAKLSEVDEVVNWWAAGRYRRSLLEGLQAALLPIAEALSQAPSKLNLFTASAEKLSRLPGSLPIGYAPPTSSECATETDGAAIAYRLDRTRSGYLVAIFCSGDAQAHPPADADPDLFHYVDGYRTGKVKAVSTQKPG